MALPPELKEEVGFLCAEMKTKNGVKKEVVGTCFFVTVPTPDNSRAFGYLVTAKHVTEELLKHPRAYVRLNKYSYAPGESGVTYIELSNNWYCHADASVDVTVLPWANPKGGNYTCVSLSIADIVTTPEFIRSHGGHWPPLEGTPVVFAGLMYQHIGSDRNVPIVRRGHVACVSQEPIEGVYGPSAHYLVEMMAYPGHSGGPVWAVYDKTMFLLGVVSAGFPTKQRVVETKKTKKGKVHTEVVEYVNLGISLVAPVEKLVEILNSSELEQLRKSETPKPGRLIPVANPAPEARSDSERKPAGRPQRLARRRKG